MVGALGSEEAVNALYVTHNRAEEVDHGVLRPALPRGRGGGFLRAWRQSASERSLRMRRKTDTNKRQRNCDFQCFYIKLW